MTQLEGYVIPLGSVRRMHAEKVGGKAAVVGELRSSGLRVPDGFCITSDALRDLVPDLPPIGTLDTEGLAHLRQRILTTHVPAMLVSAVEQAVRAVRVVSNDYPLYAVRSSASVEDTGRNSFAGQFSTSIVPAELVVEAMKQCWSSLYDESPNELAVQSGAQEEPLNMSVLVQSLIPADLAGVIFTRDPLTGEHVITIECSWGLGEAVVGGIVTPDHVRTTPSGEVLQYRIGSKRKTVSIQGGSVRKSDTDPIRAAAQCMSIEEIHQAARIAEKVDRLLGPGQDIEFAIYMGKLWVLQARPITSLPLNGRSDTGRAGSPA